MDDRKQGWLQEILNAASEDVKSWPRWLRDEKPDHANNKQCAADESTKKTTDQSNKSVA